MASRAEHLRDRQFDPGKSAAAVSTACTAFDGHRLIASGPGTEVALAVRRAIEAGADGPVQVFDDRSGRPVEFDLRGSEAELLARQRPAPAAPRGPGRPRLGVMPREVSLLPRHWDWLAAQPGGASAVLRRLVERAIREGGPAADRARADPARQPGGCGCHPSARPLERGPDR